MGLHSELKRKADNSPTRRKMDPGHLP